jgi:hypothetical protein
MATAGGVISIRIAVVTCPAHQPPVPLMTLCLRRQWMSRLWTAQTSRSGMTAWQHHFWCSNMQRALSCVPEARMHSSVCLSAADTFSVQNCGAQRMSPGCVAPPHAGLHWSPQPGGQVRDAAHLSPGAGQSRGHLRWVWTELGMQHSQVVSDAQTCLARLLLCCMDVSFN